MLTAKSTLDSSMLRCKSSIINNAAEMHNSDSIFKATPNYVDEEAEVTPESSFDVVAYRPQVAGIAGCE